MTGLLETVGDIDLSALDFDEQVPCTYSESKDAGKTWTQCEVPAAWSVIMPCCGAVRYACGRHLAAAQRHVLDPSYINECRVCGHVCPRVGHCAFVSSPLRGRS